MKPEPSTLSTPHKSNDVSHSKTPEDIALDKQILRSQIRPQRLIAKTPAQRRNTSRWHSSTATIFFR